MLKWYENDNIDSGIVISSRVRLARNVKKYSFSNIIEKKDSEKMIEEIKNSIINDRTSLGNQFRYIEVNSLNNHSRLSMMEKHIISPVLVNKKQSCGVLVKDDETINIMLNEEDHIRIQTIYSGESIEKAWDMADKTDNLIEESIEYAFDENYGYLTACPTNVGTGLRASYMMHLPALEKTGQLRNVIQAISKFGITVRGTYGEGTEAMGSIYQISNQVTLGQSEEEIRNNLKNVANQVIEQEERMKEKILKERKDDFEDNIYRSYGILKNARKISGKEAMDYLSNMREGYLLGVLDIPKPKINIYQLMMNIQPGCLQNYYNNTVTPDKTDQIRAKYIREQLL